MFKHQIIRHGNKNFALIIRGYPTLKNGIKFATPNSYSQQVAFMRRPQGHKILPHRHIISPRKILWTSEVLLIKRGKVKVLFFNNRNINFKSVILKKWNIILLIHGAHAFKMLGPSEIIEIKQGPYVNDDDKTRFKSIVKEKIKIK